MTIVSESNLTNNAPDEIFWISKALTNGNKGRGGSWHHSSKDRKEFERLLAGHKTPTFRGVVSIEVIRVLGKNERLWDADSIGRGNAKELIDAMVAVGIFTDDSPKYISNCHYRQKADRREVGPVVIVKVWND